MIDRVAVDLIVFGRGTDRTPVGDEIVLSPASEARVDAALDHIEAHLAVFDRHRQTEHRGRVIFSGGYGGAAEGMAPTPADRREGRLMLELARRRMQDRLADGTGLDTYVDAHAETESDSTLENVLRVHEGRYLADRTFTPTTPLGLVAHTEHLARCDYFTRKILRIAEDAVHHIPADGHDRRSRNIPETSLYRVTRLACAGARRPVALRRRERLMVSALRRLTR